ncbi:MAG: hypothetical protein WC651_00710 [Candidatus Gracilibacteria bacterium]|jgi:hypothetical protein
MDSLALHPKEIDLPRTSEATERADKIRHVITGVSTTIAGTILAVLMISSPDKKIDIPTSNPAQITSVVRISFPPPELKPTQPGSISKPNSVYTSRPKLKGSKKQPNSKPLKPKFTSKPVNPSSKHSLGSAGTPPVKIDGNIPAGETGEKNGTDDKGTALRQQLEKNSGGLIRLSFHEEAFTALNRMNGPRYVSVKWGQRITNYICDKNCSDNPSEPNWEDASTASYSKRRLIEGKTLTICSPKLYPTARAGIERAQYEGKAATDDISANAELIITWAKYWEIINTIVTPWLVLHPEMADKEGLHIHIGHNGSTFFVSNGIAGDFSPQPNNCKEVRKQPYR